MERIKKIYNIGAIYQLKSKINNKTYIGSTYDLYKRINYGHIISLKNKTHCNRYLQNHVNKYGINDIEITIVEYMRRNSNESIIKFKERLLNKEQSYINVLNPKFNLSNAVSSSLGIEYSKDTIIKLQKRFGIEIIQYDLTGKEINRFLSINDAALKTNIPKTTIYGSLKYGKRNLHYIWGYKNEDISHKIEKAKNIKPYPMVFQFDIYGNFIAEYINTTEACRKTKIKNTRINMNIKGKTSHVGHFLWTYGNNPSIEQILKAIKCTKAL